MWLHAARSKMWAAIDQEFSQSSWLCAGHRDYNKIGCGTTQNEVFSSARDKRDLAHRVEPRRRSATMHMLLCLLLMTPASLQPPTSRRQVLAVSLFASSSVPATAKASASGGAAALFDSAPVSAAANSLVEVTDPATYSALVYEPPQSRGKKLPLILVLHGAGVNEAGVWSLADPMGEHAGLAPSLLAAGRAPPELADNFAVVAPYAAGKRSFYEDPRKKLLAFVDWVVSPAGRAAGCPNVDPGRVFLVGFSDGATVGVELATTRRFAGAVIAAYGFTGELPSRAAQLLADVPLWIFHSADDVIFSVDNSDKLVRTLQRTARTGAVRYTRFDVDQEGFTGRVRGHSTGITATKDPEVYRWLLSLQPLA